MKLFSWTSAHTNIGRCLWIATLWTVFIICSKAASPNKCQPGYTPLSSGCYLPLSLATQIEGFELCQEKKGRLVTLETSEEQDTVIAWLQNISSFDNVFLGLRMVSNFVFNNVYDGKKPTYIPWYPGEPNQESEKCVTLLQRTKSWFNDECTSKHRIVCEQEKGLIPSNSPSNEVNLLYDGNNDTCVEKIPRSEIVHKEQGELESFSVEIMASICEEPYLTVAQGDSCSSRTCTFTVCSLTAVHTDGKKNLCTFYCKCATSCFEIAVQINSVNNKAQSICEITIF